MSLERRLLLGTQLGGLAAALGGTLEAARVVVGYLSPDPDYWDCNSSHDYAQNALDGVGFGLLALGILAVRAYQGAAGGRLGAAGAVAGALGSVAIAISNPLEHCARFPAIGFVAGVLLLTLGTLVLGVSVLRAGVLPRWCGVALFAAAIAPFPLQDNGILLAGLVWLAVGLAVLTGITRIRLNETPRTDRRGAPVLSSRLLARVGAAAAILGGIAWTVKGVGILATGDQPPVVFELGPPLFAVGLIGLYARLGQKGGRAAVAGLVLACVSILLAGVLLVAWAFASEALPAGEDDFTPLSLVIAGAGFSFIAGLVLLGIAARRAPVLPRRWRSFPLAVGVFAVPGIMIGGGILSELNERLLEIPLVAFALGWIVIGYLIWPSNQADRAR